MPTCHLKNELIFISTEALRCWHNKWQMRTNWIRQHMCDGKLLKNISGMTWFEHKRSVVNRLSTVNLADNQPHISTINKCRFFLTLSPEGDGLVLFYEMNVVLKLFIFTSQFRIPNLVEYNASFIDIDLKIKDNHNVQKLWLRYAVLSTTC